jgi:hypothetical protein
MNTHGLRRAAVALCLLATSWAQAQISEPEAETLMRASGLWQQIGNAAPAMRAGLAQSLEAPGATVPEATRQQLLAAADAAFVPGRLQAVARKSLAERVRKVHLPALSAWYATPEGQRITAAEVSDSERATDTETDVREGMKVLEAAAPARRQLIGRVTSAETGADLMMNMAVGMQLGVARVTPGAPQPDERTLRAPLEAQRAQLQRTFLGIAVASFARAYQSVPDDTLARYVSFLASAAGEHYTDIGLAAMEDAMLDALGALGRR